MMCISEKLYINCIGLRRYMH